MEEDYQRALELSSPMATDAVCSNAISVETNQRFQIVRPTLRIFFLQNALLALGTSHRCGGEA